MTHVWMAALPELGVLCVALACALACVQCFLPPVRGKVVALAQAAFVALALALLIVCRLRDDFSVANVAEHSNRTLPLLYKIVGAWGNHEGSMLLVVLVLSVFQAVLAAGAHPARRAAVPVQAAICVGFFLFILLTSNPFARLFPPQEDGAALNPLLQDMALAIHPPLLYVGYMGFSVVFALAVAALLEGRLTREWAVATHPWIMAAWSFLTLGITLGSWWAYRELGWGGYWFWDPVENASLLPWLSGTALLHANLTLKRRGALKHWVLLLSILTFAMSMLGTFLVRSGAVSSVHSFAEDPTRGLFILGFFALFSGGALLLYALRAGRIASDITAQPLSREGLIVFNGLLLTVALATLLLGTIYPLISELFWQQSLTVGPPYFHATFIPVAAATVLLAALGPLAAWQQDNARRLALTLRYPLAAALAAGALTFACTHTHAATAAGGFALGAWLIAGTLRYALRPGNAGCKLATIVAHMGAAVLVLGITGMGAWKAEAEKIVKPGEHISAGGYRFTLQEVSSQAGDNHVSTKALLAVTDAGGQPVVRLAPEYRRYAIRGTGTSEAAVASQWWGDLYAVSGQTEDAGTPLRIYINPLAHLLWGGAVLMAAGGLLALRRHDAQRASKRKLGCAIIKDTQ